MSRYHRRRNGCALIDTNIYVRDIVIAVVVYLAVRHFGL